MVKRNHSYNIGEVVEATGGYLLKCKVAGTTDSNPIIIGGGGAELVDGTVTWQVIEDSDMPSDIMETLAAESWGDWDANNRWVAPEDGYLLIGSDKNVTLYLQSRGDIDVICSIQPPGTTWPTIFIPVRCGYKCRWQNSSYAQFYYSIKSAKKLGLM